MPPEGEHTHEQAEQQIVTPVVETESKLVEPVLNHAVKISALEERHARHEERLTRELSDLEARVASATGERERVLQERITAIEARLEEASQAGEQATEQAVEGAAEFVAPDVEETPAAEKRRRIGSRKRRK